MDADETQMEPRKTRTTRNEAARDNPEEIEAFSPRLARSDYLGWTSKMISTLKGLDAGTADKMQPFQGWG
jgi:hypothetical protein